jgi:Fe-S-cluster containining protein
MKLESIEPMTCRIGCGACCIAPSISSPIMGLPDGKRPGVRCLQLTDENVCRIHGSGLYPAVCSNFKPDREMCGQTFSHALAYLTRLEALTGPDAAG